MLVQESKRPAGRVGRENVLLPWLVATLLVVAILALSPLLIGLTS